MTVYKYGTSGPSIWTNCANCYAKVLDWTQKCPHCGNILKREGAIQEHFQEDRRRKINIDEAINCL